MTGNHPHSTASQLHRMKRRDFLALVGGATACARTRGTWLLVYISLAANAHALDRVIPEPLSPQAVEVIQQGVRSTLKEPDTALFGNMIGGRDSKGRLHVCGWINGKNSFGTYSGMTPFAGVMIEVPDPDNPLRGFHVVRWEASAALAACKEMGLSLEVWH
jgi:hypothetical protein